MLMNKQLELEQEILGSIFLNIDLMIKAEENIKPNMFQITANRNIYIGIQKMIENKKEVDLINFIETYKEVIGEMGGIPYFTEVYNSGVTEVAFETKLELMIHNYKKMEIIKFAISIDDTMTLSNMEEAMDNTKEKILSATLKKELEIEDMFNSYIVRLYDENKDNGIKSGFKTIDEALGNFQKGRLVGIFSRSGVGKSTVAIQMALNMALMGAGVIYGSGEMSRDEILNKMAASYCSIEYEKLERKEAKEDEKDKVSDFIPRLLKSNFYISEENNIDKFINEIKVYKLKHKLDVVFVDYINNYVDYSRGGPLTEKIGEITKRLKELAKKEEICIILLAQANRVVDSRVNTSDTVIDAITQADIQDSARIEQDCDQLIALYRNKNFDDKAYMDNMFRNNKIDYNSKSSVINPSCINAKILKNRHGKGGTKALKWEPKFSRVGNFG